MRRVCSIILFSLALAGLAMPVASQAQVICTGNASPPPELPVYEQPPIPAPGYVWVPGYWGIGPVGYYWVPGTWVLPPTVGFLWTPGYWAWRDGIYVWNAGYWGPHVGFYGGVNYGFGYGGVGYEGGRWDNGVFIYNRTVNNFGSVTITHVYEKNVYVEPGASRVSFNGGSGGTTVRPTQEEQAAAHEQHVAAVPSQLQHEHTASEDKALLASENHGKPAIAATTKPGEFTGKGVVAAKETPTTSLPDVGAKNPGAMGTNPAKTFEERGIGTAPSATNPAAKSATNPTGPKTFEERGIGTGPSGTNPAAKSATNPTGPKTFEQRGIGTGPSGTNPAAKSATNPTGPKTFEERGIGTGPSATNPGSVRSPTNPTGPSAANPGLSGARGIGAERATLNGGNAPRMPNTGAAPLQPTPHAAGRPQGGGGQQQKNKDKDKDH
jgi:YXWGXW repeat-containing protein